MQHPTARRLLAGLAVAGALLMAGAAPAYAGAAPAHAAPHAGAAPAYAAPAADAGITMYLTDATIPVGSRGVPLEPSWWATTETILGQPTITYELSDGLTGVTLSDPGGVGDCANQSPTKLVCSDASEMAVGPDGITGWFVAQVTAGRTAKPGTTGTVTATFSAADLAPISTTAKVRVAQSVDLAAGRHVQVTASPGEAFSAPLVVRNAGKKAAKGASVIFYNDRAFESTTRYSNCLYSGDELRSCTFDQALRSGASYRATLPYRVRVDTRAPGFGYGEIIWLTPAELEDYHSYLKQRGIDVGAPGQGDVLRLDQAITTFAVPQGDADTENNSSAVELTTTGKNGVDLAAVGAEVKGFAGDEVTVSVGVHNNGPATLDLSRAGSSAAATAVYPPAGTSVVSVPQECAPEVDGSIQWDLPDPRGYPKYLCLSDSVLIAGEGETYDFGLRIDKVIPDAKGTVAVNEPCECERFTDDIDPSNNKAAITMRGPGAGSGGTGGAGGGLPVTGPMGATIGGAGIVLLAAGVVGVVLARRRRTRFVA
jgi:hypothetical protein